MSSKVIRACFILCISYTAVGCATAEDFNNVLITVDAGSVEHTISTNLTGINILFSEETDSLWADGRIAGYLKDIKAGVLRFPGGEVTDYYHYSRPGYPRFKDIWQTVPDAKDYAGDEKINNDYMDVNEFLVWCGRIGAEPLLGINMESGLLFDRVNDSISEAADIVRYCNVIRDYNVTYWYLSNETYGINSTHRPMNVGEYAEMVNRFGRAMRGVDPNIKFIVNWDNKLGEPNCLTQWQYLLKNAGDYIDIADVHWYWATTYCDWQLWLDDNPMKVREWCHICPDKRYVGPSLAEEIRQFHKMLEAMGSDVRPAVLEWNIGRNINFTFSPFQHALMQAEMLGQFIEGDLYMATMWPLTWHGSLGNDFRTILAQDNHQPTPSFYVLKLYSNILGQQFVASRTDRLRIRPVSARSLDGKTLWLYLLNKTAAAVKAEVVLRAFKAASAQAVVLAAPHVSADQASLEQLEVRLNRRTGWWEAVLPPYSLTMLTFHR
jgi:alpha-N-arabinofuranosidase